MKSRCVNIRREPGRGREVVDETGEQIGFRQIEHRVENKHSRIFEFDELVRI